jgi:hypothetical protein
MQLLEDSIRKFKAELRTLTGADSSSTARRKKSRAVWKETKEAAKKTVNTELLKEMGLEDWAQATNEQHAKRLSEHVGAKDPGLYGSVRKDGARARTCRFSRGGKGQVLAWSLEEKALVAPFAVELRHLIRRLAKHRVLFRIRIRWSTWRMSRHLGRVQAPRWRTR